MNNSQPTMTDTEKEFSEIRGLIEKAKSQALKSVNKELITLYWNVGERISRKLNSSQWGDAVVDQLATYLRATQPELKGFSRRGLYRMRQFYETYSELENVSTLLTQISWSSHLHIMAKTKTIEEKEFYLRLAVKEKYAVRELERQIDSCLYERIMLSKSTLPKNIKEHHENAIDAFRDTYVLEFLRLPEYFSEQDLRKKIVANLKKFLLEIGSDFSFIAEEYRVQVGGNDYFIDLLFYHRGLFCLVAVELKVTDFKPEYLGKMDFYLEALDRLAKKPGENPSVGILLCKSKDYEVVEFALSRNISPTLVAEYKTKLIDKKILTAKLHELFQLEEK
jgi:predicted nuclease of restriction endonuclease-like (RecB) superfamily